MTATASPLPSTSTGSIRQGIWFVFPVGSDTLRVWGSMLSGNERIYVNETLAHEERSFRRENVNTVSIGGQDFQVVVKVKSIISAELECRLQQNGKVLDAYVAKLSEAANPPFKRIVLSSLGLGLLFGLLRFPDWLLWVLIAAVVLYWMVKIRNAGSSLTVEKVVV